MNCSISTYVCKAWVLRLNAVIQYYFVLCAVILLLTEIYSVLCALTPSKQAKLRFVLSPCSVKCLPPLPRQHPSYGDCLEVKREYYQNCFVLGCVHNVHSQQHTHMSSSYRSSRLGLSHWDPYAMRRGGCLELYYCNMVEWSWWDSGLICKTNWFPSVL